MRNRVIVFDLDDTLYPERDYARGGLLAAGSVAERKFGLGGLGVVALRLFDEGRRGDIFQESLRMLGHADCGGTVVSALVDAYRNHIPELRLFPDVAEVLPRLERFGRLALVTDGYLPPQRLKVQALGLESLLDPVIYTEQLGRHCWKPSEQAFVAIEERCASRSIDCIYVADNPKKDFIAPRRRKWSTVRIRRADTEHANASGNEDAEVEMKDFRELEIWLAGAASKQSGAGR